MAKEHASLERLQEKRDSAVSAIANALQKHRKVSAMEPAAVTSEDQGGAPFVEEKPPDAMVAESNLDDVKESPENENVEVMSYP
ncbi:hypothetical protein, partial [Klebsiella pneumoniae]|uniref:hypothetical protein n=1 Tax=Klebsiella pneumoniae TaxID=573 RepID=UPI0024DE4523